MPAWISLLPRRLVSPYQQRRLGMFKRIGNWKIKACSSCSKFQQSPYLIIIFNVTGKRVNRDAGYALEISVTCTCIVLEKSIMWIQRKISEEMKTTDNMKNKCLKWNSWLLFFPSPLIQEKFQRKSLFDVKKICMLIRVSGNCLFAFWRF